MGGRELVRRLREAGATVPVLFISGYADGTSPARTDDTGRSAFLAKPFDIGVFVRLVGELVQGVIPCEAAPARVLRTG
jgi:FixJ family two-component response regulator